VGIARCRGAKLSSPQRDASRPGFRPGSKPAALEGTWDTAIDDETPRGDSTPRFAGLERGWDRPNVATQEPIALEYTTITYCSADPRIVSLPNLARWDWNPSKTSQIVPFYPIDICFPLEGVPASLGPGLRTASGAKKRPRRKVAECRSRHDRKTHQQSEFRRVCCRRRCQRALRQRLSRALAAVPLHRCSCPWAPRTPDWCRRIAEAHP
jgi:hypothetical protein